MADDKTPARNGKLIQYLNEAYGKERELETALRAHISMTTRDAYKKRLQDHLKETTQQAKGLERRIKALGGKAERMDVPGPDVATDVATAATAVASKAVSLAKGPLHMIRGTGEAEKLLKNAKTELWNEFEEIGNYLSIEQLANTLGDKETEKLAREFRKQEERMAAFLQKLIPQLTKLVAREEIPASERNGGTSTTRKRSTSSRSAASSRSNGSRSTSGSGSTRKKSASSGSSSARTKKAASSRSTSRATSSASKPKAKSSGSTTRSRSTTSKRTTSRASGSSSARAKSGTTKKK